MYLKGLLIALLSSLPLSFAAPTLLECTNYPGYVAGSLIGKPLGQPTSLPPAGQIRWCRSGSTMYLSFSKPSTDTYNSAMEQEFENLFSSALTRLKSLGTGTMEKALEKHKTVQLAGESTVGLEASTLVILTYGQLVTAVEILQNAVYETRLYWAREFNIMDGRNQVGTLYLPNTVGRN